jgi:hypothetical protein
VSPPLLRLRASAEWKGCRVENDDIVNSYGEIAARVMFLMWAGAPKSQGARLGERNYRKLKLTKSEEKQAKQIQVR